MPAHVRFLSYFTNFILLASFLGLGVGILSARRKLPLGPRTFPLLLLFAAILIAATQFELQIGSAGVLYYGAGEAGTAPPENALVLPAAFLLVSLLFVCIGRPLGILLGEVTPPLRAYAFDIVGSLAGIAAFFLLSWFEQPPAVWFVGPGPDHPAAVGPTLARPRLHGRAAGASPAVIAWNIGHGLLVVAVLQDRPHADRQRARLRAERQRERPPGHAARPTRRSRSIARPYDLFGAGQFKHVLIIGAGSGSDTAIGLKYRQRRPHRRRRDRPGHRPARAPVPPRAAVLRSARDRPRRRRALVPAQEHRQVRPDHLRAARLADADVAVLELAPGELPVHRGVVQRSARPPDATTARSSSTTTTARTGCCESSPACSKTAFGQAPYVAELRRLGSRGRAGRRPAAADAAGPAARAEPAVHRGPHRRRRS